MSNTDQHDGNKATANKNHDNDAGKRSFVQSLQEKLKTLPRNAPSFLPQGLLSFLPRRVVFFFPSHAAEINDWVEIASTQRNKLDDCLQRIYLTAKKAGNKNSKRSPAVQDFYTHITEFGKTNSLCQAADQVLTVNDLIKTQWPRLSFPPSFVRQMKPFILSENSEHDLNSPYSRDMIYRLAARGEKADKQHTNFYESVLSGLKVDDAVKGVAKIEILLDTIKPNNKNDELIKHIKNVIKNNNDHEKICNIVYGLLSASDVLEEAFGALRGELAQHASEPVKTSSTTFGEFKKLFKESASLKARFLSTPTHVSKMKKVVELADKGKLAHTEAITQLQDIVQKTDAPKTSRSAAVTAFYRKARELLNSSSEQQKSPADNTTSTSP